MRTRAAILLQRGVSERKQEQLCLDHIEEEHWGLVGIVPHAAAHDAAVLVSAGAVDVIVTAFDSPAIQALAIEVAPRGRVVYVHPEPAEVRVKTPLPSLVDLILRWWRHGRTVKQIAADIGSATSDVREVLRRGGEQPDRSD